MVVAGGGGGEQPQTGTGTSTESVSLKRRRARNCLPSNWRCLPQLCVSVLAAAAAAAAVNGRLIREQRQAQ